MATGPFTVAAPALRWECSDSFIYDEIRRGNLAALRFGSKLLRITQSAVEDYEREATLTVSDDLPISGRAPTPIDPAASLIPPKAAVDLRALGRQIRSPSLRSLLNTGRGSMVRAVISKAE